MIITGECCTHLGRYFQDLTADTGPEHSTLGGMSDLDARRTARFV